MGTRYFINLNSGVIMNLQDLVFILIFRAETKVRVVCGSSGSRASLQDWDLNCLYNRPSWSNGAAS